MTSKIAPFPVESTGDERLDTILGGGLPAQSVVVIAGEPGTGKTALTLQMLFAAAKRGKRSLYFTTLSEPAIKLLRYMQLFEFFDQRAMDTAIVVTDLGAMVREKPESTVAEICRLVEQHEPAFVAIDTFRVIADLVSDPRVARSVVYDLATQMATWGATTVLIGEYASDELAHRAEFAVADGIIRLSVENRDLTALREFEILKLRGMDYTSGRHFFEITRHGVCVYPRVRAPRSLADTEAHDQGRCGTGMRGVDDLLGGGVPRASNTIVQGATGCGKTLLSLQFLIEGARQGERGVLFTLEETPDQLRHIASNLGWDLPAFEKQGLLVISYASPVELSTDRYLQNARDEIQARCATRAVFDSLTSMSLGVTSERRFKELIYSVSKHMRAAGVTLFMTIESRQLLGADEVTGHGVSFLADNLIQLRYIESHGHLERAVSVLKARGIEHDTALRLFRIGKGGPRVVKDRPKKGRGVLTGWVSRSRRQTP